MLVHQKKRGALMARARNLPRDLLSKVRLRSLA